MDYAAATPLEPRVLKAMMPFSRGVFGNPSSLHAPGREASAALQRARRTIADILSARPQEIVFTAGGTESVNLALLGVARKAKQSGVKRPHIIVSVIEHQAVLEACWQLENEGCHVSYVGVDGMGRINMDELKKSVRGETVLISVMYANNEIGTIQPVAEVGKWLRGENERRRAAGRRAVLLHTDACQAAGVLDLNVSRLGVDLLSANGSKIYGPKQSGFLYIRAGAELQPLVFGGGQERGMRSGTENVWAAVGLAEALYLAQKDRQKENVRVAALRDQLYAGLRGSIPDILLNGDDHDAKRVNQKQKIRRAGTRHAEIIIYHRLPNNLNITVPGVEGEALMLYLDAYGISVSTGSACVTASNDPSHVLLAVGRTQDQARSSVRFTLGAQTTKRDVDYVIKVFPAIVRELRKVKVIGI